MGFAPCRPLPNPAWPRRRGPGRRPAGRDCRRNVEAGAAASAPRAVRDTRTFRGCAKWSACAARMLEYPLIPASGTASFWQATRGGRGRSSHPASLAPRPKLRPAGCPRGEGAQQGPAKREGRAQHSRAPPRAGPRRGQRSTRRRTRAAQGRLAAFHSCRRRPPAGATGDRRPGPRPRTSARGGTGRYLYHWHGRPSTALMPAPATPP